MERSFIRERHQIITDTYHDLSINDAFMDEINDIEWCNSYRTNVGAKMSDWKIESDNITKIYEWVIKILKDTYDHDGSINSLNLHESWYAKYDVGDRTKVHDHKFSSWSFVYYINAPEGASSLYFPTSNKEIKCIPGRVVVFPGNVEHYVPENKCDNRVILAGNIK